MKTQLKNQLKRKQVLHILHEDSKRSSSESQPLNFDETFFSSQIPNPALTSTSSMVTTLAEKTIPLTHPTPFEDIFKSSGGRTLNFENLDDLDSDESSAESSLIIARLGIKAQAETKAGPLQLMKKENTAVTFQYSSQPLQLEGQGQAQDPPEFQIVQHKTELSEYSPENISKKRVKWTQSCPNDDTDLSLSVSQSFSTSTLLNSHSPTSMTHLRSHPQSMEFIPQDQFSPIFANNRTKTTHSVLRLGDVKGLDPTSDSQNVTASFHPKSYEHYKILSNSEVHQHENESQILDTFDQTQMVDKMDEFEIGLSLSISSGSFSMNSPRNRSTVNLIHSSSHPQPHPQQSTQFSPFDAQIQPQPRPFPTNLALPSLPVFSSTDSNIDSNMSDTY